MQTPRPERLAAAFDYAEDRAGSLDVHQSVVAALEATNDLDNEERADVIVATIRETARRTALRRLGHEARYRELVAGALIAAALP